MAFLEKNLDDHPNYLIKVSMQQGVIPLVLMHTQVILEFIASYNLFQLTGLQYAINMSNPPTQFFKDLPKVDYSVLHHFFER